MIAPTHKTVELIAGEALQGFALRYAAKVGVTPRQLLRNGLRLGGVDLASLPFRPDAIAALAHLSGMSPGAAAALSFEFREQDAYFRRIRLAHWLLRPGQRRVAPGALRRDGERPWMRLHWSFPFLSCDPQSGEVLVDRCGACGGRLSWLGCVAVERCQHCAYDLRDAQPRVAAPADVESCKGLVGLLDPGSSNDVTRAVRAALGRASVGGLLVLFDFLERMRAALNGVLEPPDAANVGPGALLAAGWPASFDEILAGHLREVSGAGAGLGFVAITQAIDVLATTMHDPKLERAVRDRTALGTRSYVSSTPVNGLVVPVSDRHVRSLAAIRRLSLFSAPVDVVGDAPSVASRVSTHAEASTRRSDGCSSSAGRNTRSGRTGPLGGARSRGVSVGHKASDTLRPADERPASTRWRRAKTRSSRLRAVRREESTD